MIVGVTGAFLLLLLGVPIFLALGSAAILLSLFVAHVPIMEIANGLVTHINRYEFLAIPLFILAGNLMTRGGVTEGLIDLVESFVGRLPGALGLIVVFSCAIFATMTGSGVAAVAAVGSMMIKPMVEKGYSVQFSTGLVCSAGALGVLIPPSIPMIIYGGITDESVPALFAAGLLPGIMITILLAITVLILCWRAKVEKGRQFTWPERGRAFVRTLPILGLPVLMLGSIYSGLATPTESAALGATYSFFLGKFVTRRLTGRALYQALQDSVKLSGMVLLIAANALLFGSLLTRQGITQQAVAVVTANLHSPIAFLIGVNILYTVLGCFIDTVTLQLTTTPILYPVLASLGISGIHFGIVQVINMEIALLTPPVGMNLFVAAGLMKVPVNTVVRGAWPFYFAYAIGLMVITYVPEISLILPRAMGFIH